MAGLTEADLAAIDDQLAAADALLAQYPGERTDRQPVHTVYVPADAAGPQICREWGQRALGVLDEMVTDAADAAAVTGLPEDVLAEVLPVVRRTLAQQPVEDLRLDFENGYGRPPDDVEDDDAIATAGVLAAVATGPGAPLSVGVRIKSLEAPTRHRALRTLDLLVGSLGELPPGFVVTLPKVSSVQQVTAMVLGCERLEAAHGLAAGALRLELQVETAQAVLGPDGAATVARMLHAAAGRCVGLAFVTFDYSAALGISPAHQSLEHPAADHAKAVMQLAAAGTGVRVSDGSSNVLPVGGPDEVAAALRLHARLVTRSLQRGFYQGWDMHPGHLVSRYLATYAFFRAEFPAAAGRLRAYLGGVAGGVLDEPATARALAAAVLRGVQSGAVDEHQVRRAAGVSTERLAALLR